MKSAINSYRSIFRHSVCVPCFKAHSAFKRFSLLVDAYLMREDIAIPSLRDYLADRLSVLEGYAKDAKDIKAGQNKKSHANGSHGAGMERDLALERKKFEYSKCAFRIIRELQHLASLHAGLAKRQKDNSNKSTQYEEASECYKTIVKLLDLIRQEAAWLGESRREYPTPHFYEGQASYFKAKSLEAQGKLSQAAAQLRIAFGAFSLAGKAGLALKAAGEGVELMEKCKEKPVSIASHCLAAAKFAEENGKFAEAHKLYSKAHSSAPLEERKLRAEAFEGLARCLLKQVGSWG
ncbi:MAG: hypothetical protein N3E51_03900 [Candidatus Micrarchaeota archaeon]|nr:hypothetical protein [Candidatus Micrarchaeota archaeon]